MNDSDSTANQCELLFSRTFDASREQVYRAWTDPVCLAQWWGPKGFTSTFYEFDLRPGGVWRFTMHAPNGGNFENTNVFVEIFDREMIVFDHIVAPLFRMIATFDDVDRQTRITCRMVFKTAEECDRVKELASNGNREMFDRLAEVLAGPG